MTKVLGDDPGAELADIDVEQVEKASFRQFHGYDDVARVAPDLIDVNQVGMFQLTNRLQAADFLGRGQLRVARQELEGDRHSIRAPGFPYLAPPSAPQKAN